jgi:tRNA A37 threonylcarbamoyladenosine dehydratase
MIEDDPRFRGTRQLLGEQHFERIRNSSVCVIGLGGVGSWSVEALARSGVGEITLVDLDEICVTNINRQIHALTDTVGLSKAELLASRVSSINPECKVRAVKKFFSELTADEILSHRFDVVLDTIDRNENKTLLIAECVRRSLPIVTVGSGGDRVDAHAATVTDLARTIHDPLLQIVRKNLRQQHGFPKGERAKCHIPCVYAPSQRNDKDARRRQSCDPESGSRKSCNDGLGSAVFVTGALGFMAAGEVIRLLGEVTTSVCYPWYSSKRDGCTIESA